MHFFNLRASCDCPLGETGLSRIHRQVHCRCGYLPPRFSSFRSLITCHSPHPVRRHLSPCVRGQACALAQLPHHCRPGQQTLHSQPSTPQLPTSSGPRPNPPGSRGGRAVATTWTAFSTRCSGNKRSMPIGWSIMCRAARRMNRTLSCARSRPSPAKSIPVPVRYADPAAGCGSPGMLHQGSRGRAQRRNRCKNPCKHRGFQHPHGSTTVMLP